MKRHTAAQNVIGIICVRRGSINGALVSHSLQSVPGLKSFNLIFLCSGHFCGLFESQKSVIKSYQVRVVGFYCYFSIPCAEIKLLVLGNREASFQRAASFTSGRDHIEQSLSASHPFCLAVLSQSSWVTAQLYTASRFIKYTLSMGRTVAVTESSQRREVKWQEDFC